MISIPELVQSNSLLKKYPNPTSENLFLSDLEQCQIGQKAIISNYLGQKIVEFQIESIN